MRVLRAPAGEELATNCIAYQRQVIMPQGHKKTEALLRDNGFTPVPIDLSQFEAGRGGATCLSIRF